MKKIKVWKLGFLYRIVAIVAFGVAAIAGNRNLGFGYRTVRQDQLGLFAASAVVCALQLVSYQSARGKENDGNKRV